jgi:hypothetical protein
VGTNGSVAGAIFGIGLLWAATNPRAHVAWVILTIIYAVLLVVYQVYASAILHNPWQLPPIVFGLLGGLLVAALYPTAPRRPPPRPAVSAPAAAPAISGPSSESKPAPPAESTTATEGGQEK